MRIIGFTEFGFTGKDGNPVNGVTFYCDEPIRKGGLGYRPAKPFSLSTARVDAIFTDIDVADCVGIEIEPLFNRWGKVADIIFK